jgi:hypothetical protein
MLAGTSVTIQFPHNSTAGKKFALDIHRLAALAAVMRS